MQLASNMRNLDYLIKNLVLILEHSYSFTTAGDYRVMIIMG